MRELRDYQLEGDQAVYDGWAATGGAPQAVVLPTGCGKTDVIAKQCVDEVAAGGHPLVLADREELLDQIAERVQMHAPVTVGRVQGDLVQARRQVVTAMVQTLRSPRRQRQYERQSRPTKIIVDECDLATAPGYASVFGWAGDVRRMGVTATLSRPKPKRGELGLGDVWPHVAFQRDIGWAVREGWLVPPRGIAVVTEGLDLEHAKIRGGDYVDAELGEMVTQGLPEIVAAWFEHGQNRITGGYWPTVAAAQAATDAFNAAGVKSEVVTGTTSYSERRGIYERVKCGVTRVLNSVGVLTRGWDLPELSLILMGRPTKMEHLFVQIVGRGLRPAPWAGKQDCLVLDVVGTSRVVGLMSTPQLYRGVEADDEDQPAEPRERIEVSEPQEPRRRLLGPDEVRYGEVDLLGELRAGALNWLETAGGTVFCRAGDRYLLLWRDTAELWSAGWITASGREDGGWVVERVPFVLAREAAEGMPQARKADVREAPWRTARKRASDKQVALATRLKIVDPGRFTSGGLSDAIEVVMASRRIDRP